MGDTLDENYYITILDPKTHEPIGDEEQFHTLEEVLGFLHKLEEPENRERMFTCLMSLRDGKSEVVIRREQFQIGKQMLKIKPSKAFHELFWKGHRSE